jgi:hypothetical protein
MRKFPDISEYYTGELAIHEELNWIKVGHKHFIDFILPVIAKYDVHRIVEFACASVKHFALDEVDDIIRKVVTAGKYSILGMQFLRCDEDVADDGLGYNHVFLRESRFAGVLESVGRKELCRQDFTVWKHPKSEAYDCAILVGEVRK